MNLQGDAMTRAAQIAANAIKQKLRDEGCKATDERMYGLRNRIGGMDPRFFGNPKDFSGPTRVHTFHTFHFL